MNIAVLTIEIPLVAMYTFFDEAERSQKFMRGFIKHIGAYAGFVQSGVIEHILCKARESISSVAVFLLTRRDMIAILAPPVAYAMLNTGDATDSITVNQGHDRNGVVALNHFSNSIFLFCPVCREFAVDEHRLPDPWIVHSSVKKRTVLWLGRL